MGAVRQGDLSGAAMSVKAEGRTRSELLLRVNSAIVLIAVTLTLTYVSAGAFTVLILIFASLMAWEWGRVIRKREFDSLLLLQTVSICAAAYLTTIRYQATAIGLIMAVTFLAYWLHRWRSYASSPWWSAAGVYYTGFPAIAMIGIRQDPLYGFEAIIYLFIVVWSTDTGAFFAGRFIGGPKLAPSISPKKTWAGLAGGTVVAGVAGILFAVWFGQTSLYAILFLSLGLALISQLGDLGESAIKRYFGVKDFSSFIPGHGGVLDRLDGLVFAAIGAGLVAIAADPLYPGRGLIVWP
jgi:phosphatidate cytidylyltransferase